jgi:alpha-N-arabinofuranosidase
MKAWRLGRGVVCAAIALYGTVALAASRVDVRIDAGKAGARIDRDIFGQFAEHLGTGVYGGVWVGRDSKIPNVRGIRSDVVAALKAIRVPNVRWPGGCFADEYHWRWGVGPQASRRRTLNASWGNVIEPNSFGTHEYFDFLQQIGADAYLSVNIGSGSAEEAADWFEYMTADKPTTLAKERAANGHAAPYKIKYVGLGNENWGCGGAMSADHYVEEMKRFAHYTRNLDPAQTGPTATKRIAVGWDSLNSDYTEAVMKAWKDKVWSWDIEGVSLHNYVVGGWPPHLPSTGFGENEYAIALGEAFRMDTLITKQTGIMDKYDPDKKLALVVDEWGAWLAPTPGSNPGFLQQQNSQRDALLAAVNLNIFMRHADRVRLANIAQMINVLQAMILTDGNKMVLTPTYHVFKMYKPYMDATVLPIELKTPWYNKDKWVVPTVSASAVRDKAGQVHVGMANSDPNRSITVSTTLTGVTASGVTGTIVTAPTMTAINTFDQPNTVVPTAFTGAQLGGGTLTVTLPPKSVVMLDLR